MVQADYSSHLLLAVVLTTLVLVLLFLRLCCPPHFLPLFLVEDCRIRPCLVLVALATCLQTKARILAHQAKIICGLLTVELSCL
jgi:hypothetical protein